MGKGGKVISNVTPKTCRRLLRDTKGKKGRTWVALN